MISDKHTRDKWTINQEIRNKYQIGINNALKYMDLLNNLCKKNNIKVSIAVYPWISQIYYDDQTFTSINLEKIFR